MYIIINFYKFKELDSLDIIRQKIHDYLSIRDIKGTVLLASEGININICGKKDRIKESISFINKVIDIKNIHINQSMIKEMAFKRLKVKIKKEIIKIGFNIDKKFIEKSIRLKPED